MSYILYMQEQQKIETSEVSEATAAQPELLSIGKEILCYVCRNDREKQETSDVTDIKALQPELLTNKYWEGKICRNIRKRTTSDVSEVTALQPELLTNKCWEGNIMNYVGMTENQPF